MLNANRHSTVAQHALPPSWVNRAATEFCCAEYRLTQRVLPPFGTSLLAIGQVLRHADENAGPVRRKTPAAVLAGFGLGSDTGFWISDWR